jgi:polysaccharide export outer membrane protein
MPHELSTASLPPYVIEPPDVLLIDAVRLIPKPPYKVAPLDLLGIEVTNPLPNKPITGIFSVEADGSLNLGYNYGSVQVEGLTLPEVKAAIEKQLKLWLKPPFEVTVVLAETRALQQIRGPHLVRPDGTVGLGVYGSVYVDNLTIPEAKAAIENFLSQFLLKPEISVDVAGFNSKVYYVITDAAVGDVVSRFPVTGKTTVLDAISQVNGLSQVSSKCVYLVRPTVAVKKKGPLAAKIHPSCSADDEEEAGKLDEEVYSVHWQDIVSRGDARTNYQVLPGDRIYVMAEPLIKTDVYVGLFLAPFERIFGTVGLGNSTVRQFLTPIPTNTAAIQTVP